MMSGSQPAPVWTKQKRRFAPAPFMSPASIARPKKSNKETMLGLTRQSIRSRAIDTWSIAAGRQGFTRTPLSPMSMECRRLLVVKHICQVGLYQRRYEPVHSKTSTQKVHERRSHDVLFLQAENIRLSPALARNSPGNTVRQSGQINVDLSRLHSLVQPALINANSPRKTTLSQTQQLLPDGGGTFIPSGRPSETVRSTSSFCENPAALFKS